MYREGAVCPEGAVPSSGAGAAGGGGSNAGGKVPRGLPYKPSSSPGCRLPHLWLKMGDGECGECTMSVL